MNRKWVATRQTLWKRSIVIKYAHWLVNTACHIWTCDSLGYDILWYSIFSTIVASIVLKQESIHNRIKISFKCIILLNCFGYLLFLHSPEKVLPRSIAKYSFSVFTIINQIVSSDDLIININKYSIGLF